MVDSILRSAPTHVIFDLDGVLLDTEPLYAKVTRAIAASFGKRCTEELRRRCMGGDQRRSAELMVTALELPLSVDEYMRLREESVLRALPDAEEIVGAAALVAELQARQIPIGLATSSYRHVCDAKLGGRPFEKSFATVVCGDHRGLRHPKPAPDIFCLVAEQLGARPSACLVFEDSANGLEAALAAGMMVVAVTDPEFGVDPVRFPDLVASVPDLSAISLASLGL